MERRLLLLKIRRLIFCEFFVKISLMWEISLLSNRKSVTFPGWKFSFMSLFAPRSRISRFWRFTNAFGSTILISFSRRFILLSLGDFFAISEPVRFVILLIFWPESVIFCSRASKAWIGIDWKSLWRKLIFSGCEINARLWIFERGIFSKVIDRRKGRRRIKRPYKSVNDEFRITSNYFNKTNFIFRQKMAFTKFLKDFYLNW